MPRIKRLPPPVPFTVDVVMRHLYMAFSNKGKVQLRHIDLVNPRMVDALYSLLQVEHTREDGLTEHEQITGILVDIGRWTLVRSSDERGYIEIDTRAGGEAPYVSS